MEQLSAALGGPRLFVKRDDLTGLAFGGNKVRQMEYFTGDASAKGANVLIGGGGYAQSNHARTCAAAARALGMKPVIVVRPQTDEIGLVGDEFTGNALLTHLLCDDVRVAPALQHATRDRLAEVEARREIFEEIAQEYRARGDVPYVIAGTSTGLGVIGYVAAALELQEQLDRENVKPDYVVVTSLGVTQAGLELGARLLGLEWQVVGFAYMPAASSGATTVARLVREGATLLGTAMELDPRDIVNIDEWAGPSYGVPSRGSAKVIRTVARLEAIMLDPVYTAKGIFGLVTSIERGMFTSKHTLVFVHTGGQPALFTYAREAFESGADSFS